jgi:two-component system chemotaxis sensor kinase CheA
LILQGIHVEIDKRILEEMKDPLIHLLRNCVDHGIEKPEEREVRNKPRCGKITIAISRVSGNKVEILITDDGAGIEIAKVKEAAVKRGIVSQKEVEHLDEQEALLFIFQSEISTSPIITSISGRGMGLAIVREKVEKLGGHISVEAKPQIGSSFRILLPVLLATFRGIHIKTADQVFVIPTANVERVLRLKPEAIKTVENKETISLNGRVVSLVRLNEVLALPRQERIGEEAGFIKVLVLSAAEKRIAFVVDEVLDEQEVLVKNLGKQLARVRNVACATVLGTGKVVPILHVPDLIKSAVRMPGTGMRTVITPDQDKTKSKSILVVEDSITSRMLLKNILESAGYQIKTAVDGVDALMVLKTEIFDLVVADVEMPRMNGFDLITKIRGDKKIAQLPVVLVTALESREDRERGVEVGANAYIVKSSFDQSDLLEVIQRLI